MRTIIYTEEKPAHSSQHGHQPPGVAEQAQAQQAAPTETAPAKASNASFDLSALDTLTPSPRTAPSRDPAFTPDQIAAFYAARKRGVSWGQINGVLPKPLSRAGTLASSVHAAARRQGIEPYITSGRNADPADADQG